MSVNPDMSANMGVAEEYVDLEHQVIRQKSDVSVADNDTAIELLPGDPAAEFDPGERTLDREEIAQLVYYRRYASINFLDIGSGLSGTGDDPAFAIVDASIGINGDLFRPVTTQETFTRGTDDSTVIVDTGGEIGLLDNYQVFATPGMIDSAGSPEGVSSGIAQTSEFDIDYYNWPTGGPIVDSFDTITAGFAFGMSVVSSVEVECQFELRYDLYWDVAEQGRSTNPFGRPSTR